MDKVQEKRIFFDKLHDQLADKFKVTPKTIACIRKLILGNTFTKEECIKAHLDAGKKKPIQPEHYYPLINLLSTCSDSDFAILIKKTKFDK